MGLSLKSSKQQASTGVSHILGSVVQWGLEEGGGGRRLSDDVGGSDDNEARVSECLSECLGMWYDVKLEGEGDRNEENLSSHLFV